MPRFKLGDRVVPAASVIGTVIATCGDEFWVTWDQKIETSCPIDPSLVRPAADDEAMARVEEIEREGAQR